MSFCGDEATQNNGNILGYFLWKQIYCIFKWFYADILGVQIELCCRYPFLTWRLFGLFFEKLGDLFSNLLVTLAVNFFILPCPVY
jgi:hypothetical protein